MLSLEEKIDLLFDERPKPFHLVRSSLTLLKEETLRNFENKSIWSGLMCVMAGIDLAGKFYADDDSPGSNNSRFKKYLKEVMDFNEVDANKIYQARNAMMHSFGLFSQNKTDSYFIHPRFNHKSSFVVRETWTDGKAIHFELVIDSLFNEFKKSLPKLRHYLINTKPSNFSYLFDKYGTDKPLFEGDDFIDYCNIVNLSRRFI